MSNILSKENKNEIFRPIGDKRLFQRVADQIRVAIFKGELRPGSRLPPEPTLASMLQVSRSAVREAIKVLESTGLLTLRRGYGGGTFVTKRNTASLVSAYADLLRLSMVDVEELTQARVWLESVSLREAAKRISDKDLDALRENISEARAFYTQKKINERISSNLEFHALISEASGNIILEINIRAILSILYYYLKVMTITPQMIEHTLARHEEILLRLRRKRVEEAVVLNQDHIQEVSNLLIAAARERKSRSKPQDERHER